MKNAMTRIATGLLVATLAAGSGIALTSLAQAQTIAPTPPHHPGMGGPGGPGGPDMHGMHGGRHMMMEVERLKGSLKLNASQTALWDKAESLMKPPSDMREQMMARRDRMAAMLDDPNFDPRKLATDMDAAQAEHRAKMTAVRDAWFAVYDSLNPVQRGQAREFLRSHMSHPHGGGDRGGWMHKRDGEPGKPPMAPPPR